MLAKHSIALALQSNRNSSYPYNPAIVWSVDHILTIFVDFISSPNPLIHPIFPSLPSYFYPSQDFMVSISTSLSWKCLSCVLLNRQLERAGVCCFEAFIVCEGASSSVIRNIECRFTLILFWLLPSFRFVTTLTLNHCISCSYLKNRSAPETALLGVSCAPREWPQPSYMSCSPALRPTIFL